MADEVLQEGSLRVSRDKLEGRLPVLITAFVWCALFVGGGVHFQKFFTLRIFFNLFSDNAFLGVVAVGLTFVILTGGIDLSVGSMVGCTSIMSAWLIAQNHWPTSLGLIIPILFGLIIGIAQGSLVCHFKLPSFLVTLAGLFFCRGVALHISQESMQIKDPSFTALAGFSVGLPGKASLTSEAIIFVVIVAVGIYVARQTRFGRAIYAIGGSQTSAELMGLPVKRTIILAYALSGLCSALGGIVFTLYTSSGNATSGTGLELDAIAAVVIGGTLLRGGYGSVLGTLIGVGILGLVQTAITFEGTLSSWWTKIVIGALLLAFMLIQKAIEHVASRGVRSVAA